MDALVRSSAPVIVSHTGVSGVYPSSRNIDDEQIRSVADKGGIIGVIFAPCFLSGKLFDSASKIIDHLDHIVKSVGAKYAAIGSDFDGFIPTLPEEIRDVSDLPVITELLLRRGYREDDILGILGGNALRVFRDIEQCATR
jgi:membrane dipeptidase